MFKKFSQSSKSPSKQCRVSEDWSFVFGKLGQLIEGGKRPIPWFGWNRPFWSSDTAHTHTMSQVLVGYSCRICDCSFRVMLNQPPPPCPCDHQIPFWRDLGGRGGAKRPLKIELGSTAHNDFQLNLQLASRP